MKKVGLIINPIAGMGGRVGLKGTDGSIILDKARALGAAPLSGSRTEEALNALKISVTSLLSITYGLSMGENISRKCGFSPEVIGSPSSEETTAEDTKNAAKAMLEEGVDLLLFAGGDGTARDIYSVVGEKLVVLGIPTGVKIHSAVFAQNPVRAGELAALYIQGRIKEVREAEVMDIDEDEFRRGHLSARLYGYLKIPLEKRFTQRLKAGSPVSEQYAHEAIAHKVTKNMDENFHYIIGPGTTTRAIMDKLNLDCSLLGVDLVYRRNLIARDTNESQLLELIQGKKAKLIVTPIGGQGYLFGRGNQQISPDVLKRVGKENIIIVASNHKINGLKGRPILLDTGDSQTDKDFSDYYRVITGYNEVAVYKVSA
ncbi:MAG: ATP-NAD kinase family protein [Candidatus Aminicenantes bacterium]|jgi:predicted polyphosphate/ATP-dependent NAD kinase